ncbi:hypothetical protein ACQKGD_13450 [Peribacillus frigoritolerans]|uniref:hypothetical protein n=1 Tax=Peribacillus frigoritolerans TaxID=450367 RepID=UPI00207A373C|nr:hypothetical protein [Peribacillus frigoritolerans]USK66969.1 hypothetical protein LIT26_10290 [Peribacillus frigoritolerans]
MLSIHDSIQRDQLEMITLDQLGTLKKTREAQLLPGKLHLNPYLRLAVEPSLSKRKRIIAIVYEIFGCTIPLLAPIRETSPFLGKTIGGQGILLGASLTGHRRNTSY